MADRMLGRGAGHRGYQFHTGISFMHTSRLLRTSVWILSTCVPLTSAAAKPTDHSTDLLIVGGTESGWAAAIQAARMGVDSITIVHDGVWLDGQYTEQGLCVVDENKGVSKVGFGPAWHRSRMSFHRSGLFKELMDRIEAFNLARYGAGMPGNSWHGPSTFHPVEAEAIFRELLQPYMDSGQVTLIVSHYPVAAELDGKRLASVTFAPVEGAASTGAFTVTARMTIDASDWGEAIQVSGAAFDAGPDTREMHNEPSAPDPKKPFPPNEMNPLTWTMVIEQADHAAPIPQPLHYDARKYWHSTPYTKQDFDALKWDRPARGGGIAPWPKAGDVTRNQLSVYTVRR
ncbi:MAG: FAD-dependent oxidoreductase, partial [Planctomycetota bacterium]